jgi:2-keto-3-deoxy-L-rhamnonate aldolase RhmA
LQAKNKPFLFFQSNKEGKYLMTGVKGSALKEKIRSGQPVLGTFTGTTDPLLVKIFAQSGFDYLIIDLEHSAINLETLQQILLMFEGTPACPIVRVPWHEPAWAKWALDCGAEGLLFPNVNNAETARQVVNHCKYPPEGSRGFFPKAASNFLIDLKDYMKDINERIQVWVQIEHQDGIKNLDEILKVEGIDALFIGPADLSLSLNVFNQYESDVFTQAVNTILEKAAEKEKTVVYHLYELSDSAVKLARNKTNVFSMGFDFIFAQKGIQTAMQDIHRVLKS